ncbi:MAG: hypothetical protein RLT05_01030, partial [Bauldia litoralis]
FDLAAYYRAKGLVVVEADPSSFVRRPAPLELHTCVGSVKRLLGIRARRVVTPWQLYRHLVRARCPTRGNWDRLHKIRNLLLEFDGGSPMLHRALLRHRRRPTRNHQSGKESTMGALFSSPKAPTPPPPRIETLDPDAETREARLEALARRRRGRGGTILTSERGLLRAHGVPRQPKRLLGE